MNGSWQWGYKRVYTKQGTVPGLLTDPNKIPSDTVWLRREVQLPAGTWTGAALELKGARFCPKVYINNKLAFSASGGMAPITRELIHPDILPGRRVVIEIALLPLDKVPNDDASKIPQADIWRSNVSSCLWDDVLIHFYTNSRIKELIAESNIENDEALIRYQIARSQQKGMLNITLKDNGGKLIARQSYELKHDSGILNLPLHRKVAFWSPEHPNLYRLEIELVKGNQTYDRKELCFGYKQFKVDNLQFRLNNEPVKLRAASVVWHRWLRDPDAQTLAWSQQWFKRNIVQRLKNLGANTLRFHLGLPPERFLDLCDRYGLMVQAEWCFFHGMKASEQSLKEQWTAWFNASLKHPSVVLLHGWNETDNESELKTAFSAINDVSSHYTQPVISHRDVIHVHKYWWSLFENLGLYYNSYRQFPLPVMVDEFGGNYLDEIGNIGKYPTNEASFQRFLGANSTTDERLHHQNISNARVAEYWRRIGVAGFSPFCALSSPEDGNTWFMGNLSAGNPKPVWAALAAAYSPLSVSLNVWDRNFEPGQLISIPAYFFNDTRIDTKLSANLEIQDNDRGEVVYQQRLTIPVKKFSQVIKTLNFSLPKMTGNWKIKLVLNNPPKAVKYPVISEWDVCTYQTSIPEKIKKAIMGISPEDDELKKLLQTNHITQTSISDTGANVIILSGKNFVKKNTGLVEQLEQAVNRGKSIVILNAGPQDTGESYKGDLNDLQSMPSVKNQTTTELLLPFDIKATFHSIAEGESHIQFAKTDSSLWDNLAKSKGWLWNGYRGGIIAPASEMELSGLNSKAYLAGWKAKGADENLIKSNSYYAYELQGFYKYSTISDDSAIKALLRKEVTFLVEDAPALKTKIKPDAPITTSDLSLGYRTSLAGKVQEMIPLASAGKGLVRTPVTRLSFGPSKGVIIISQLLMDGRLVKSSAPPDFYAVRYDPVAVQFLWNMIKNALNKQPSNKP